MWSNLSFSTPKPSHQFGLKQLDFDKNKVLYNILQQNSLGPKALPSARGALRPRRTPEARARPSLENPPRVLAQRLGCAGPCQSARTLAVQETGIQTLKTQGALSFTGTVRRTGPQEAHIHPGATARLPAWLQHFQV